MKIILLIMSLAIVVIGIVCMLNVYFYPSGFRVRDEHPLSKYGIEIKWETTGASTKYSHISVSANNGKTQSPIVFGGIKNAKITFPDLNQDGVPDIRFGNKNKAQFLIVYLTQEGNVRFQETKPQANHQGMNRAHR